MESPQYEQRNNNRPFGFGDVYTTHKDADFGDGLWTLGLPYIIWYDPSKGSSRNWMEYLLPPKKTENLPGIWCATPWQQIYLSFSKMRDTRIPQDF